MKVEFKIKYFLYHYLFRKLQRLLWKFVKAKKVTAFGESLVLTPDTIFPHYRKFPLPKESYLSDIVRFTDYVQLHAICCLLDQKIEPTIMEIGASTGAYAMLLGKIAEKKHGKVIAIEPDPDSFRQLRLNIELNKLEKTVTAEQIAISDKLGKQLLELGRSESHLTDISGSLNKKTCEVSVKTLEKLIQEYSLEKIDLLLIDVEGAELLVLRGVPWERISIDSIFCELHPYAWKNYGYSKADMIAFLEERHYRAIDMYLQEYSLSSKDRHIGPTIFIKSRD
jgi:FkbM family methyltransferase